LQFGEDLSASTVLCDNAIPRWFEEDSRHGKMITETRYPGCACAGGLRQIARSVAVDDAGRAISGLFALSYQLEQSSRFSVSSLNNTSWKNCKECDSPSGRINSAKAALLKPRIRFSQKCNVIFFTFYLRLILTKIKNFDWVFRKCFLTCTFSLKMKTSLFKIAFWAAWRSIFLKQYREFFSSNGTSWSKSRIGNFTFQTQNSSLPCLRIKTFCKIFRIRFLLRTWIGI